MSKVVKLAQPGYDVKTTGDENLIYNSAWPLLKIYKQGSFSAPSNAGGVVMTTHDLGFIPMCWFFSNLPLSNYSGFSATNSEPRSEFFGPSFAVPLIYNDRIVVPDNFFQYYQSFYYYIFAIDLTIQFTAPTIKVGGVGGGRPKTIFKIAKPGKDISSPNLEDYSIHSRARSPLIHSVNPGTVNESLGGGINAFTVYHNLGYNPIFFGFFKNSDGSYHPVGTGTGGSTKFDSDEQKVRFQAASTGQEMTIVILKDPFVIDSSVQVTI